MDKTGLHDVAIHLRKGKIHRIHDGHGMRLEVLRGCLWITMDNDLRDIFLAAGEGFTVDRRGVTLVSALDDSSFALLEPRSGRRIA